MLLSPMQTVTIIKLINGPFCMQIFINRLVFITTEVDNALCNIVNVLNKQKSYVGLKCTTEKCVKGLTSTYAVMQNTICVKTPNCCGH